MVRCGCKPVRAVMEADERGDTGVHEEDNIAPAAAIAAVGPPQGLELLAVDRGTAVTAVTGGGMQVDPVDEGGHRAGLHSDAVSGPRSVRRRRRC